MWSYVARRLLYAVPILLGVSMLVFALIHLAPGDVVDLLVPPEVPRDVADALRRRFALDQPIYIQYAAWLGRLLVGELGISFFTNRPVADELFSALGNTLISSWPSSKRTSRTSRSSAALMVRSRFSAASAIRSSKRASATTGSAVCAGSFSRATGCPIGEAAGAAEPRGAPRGAS